MATATRNPGAHVSRCMRCNQPTGLTIDEANAQDPRGDDTTVRYCVGCRDVTPPWSIDDVASHQREVGAFDADAWQNAGYDVDDDGNVME